MSEDFVVSMSIDGSASIERIVEAATGVLAGPSLIKAISNARSRALSAGRELGARMARQEYAMPKAEIRKRFKFEMSGSGERAWLDFSGVPGLNLAKFQAKPGTHTAPRPKKGVSVKVKRSGRRYVPMGKDGNSNKPFVAPMRKKSQDMGIFVRKGKEKTRQMLYGPSPIQALQSYEKQERIRERIEEMFEKRLTHEIDVRLRGIIS